MRLLAALLAAVLAVLPVVAAAQSMTLCRAKPGLLDLGNPLAIARKAVAERKQLRIMALGSSSTAGYGVSNPSFAYPVQLRIGLEKALPSIEFEVINRGIGGQDVEEMAARMQEEMRGNLPSLVIWQTGSNTALRGVDPSEHRWAVAEGLAAGKTVIDMSSISPFETKVFAERINALGCDYVDAPVSGGDIGAKEARLSIMIGGAAEDVARAMPLFGRRSPTARSPSASVTACP